MKTNIAKDQRIVMTLDAGGTNFVFSAIQAGKEIVKPIRLSPNANDLDKCLSTIIEGFDKIKNLIDKKPSAISFAFPGPADYASGIIGDLKNLPAFKGGVALGPMLESYFEIPTFINNDGNLFAYGEYLFGFLPFVNASLENAGSVKRFKNLIGVTLGTGFGVGLVSKGEIIIGDNSIGGEGWLLRDFIKPDFHVEEHLSREGLRRSFAQISGLPINNVGMPIDIYNIATGQIKGDKNAAIKTFLDYGTVLGEALANIITLFDAPVVLGGGVSKAFNLFAPSMFKQLKSKFKLHNGDYLDRLEMLVFNLENPTGLEGFLTRQQKEIPIPKTNKTIVYDPFLRSGIGVSKKGASLMIALGSYAFALQNLDKQ